MRILLANMLWLLSSLPGWLAFYGATWNVKRTQCHLLLRILKENAETETGKVYRFNRIRNSLEYRAIPLSDYEDVGDAIEKIKKGKASVLTSEPVNILQPTSGSTQASKLIPYTRSLQKQFRSAINPWIVSMYLAWPSLLLGRHYWSISPAFKQLRGADSKVRIGYAEDSEYLGKVQQWLTRTLFVVPPEIARVKNPAAFEYLTLLFLICEKNLRLISVWHPSFLTLLLQAIPRNLPSIIEDIGRGVINDRIYLDPELRNRLKVYFKPDIRRAEELKKINVSKTAYFQQLWPHLRVISCWTEGISEPWLSEIENHFPGVDIQGKGLIATEGIVSFPLGRSGNKICAIGSHYLEFIDVLTGDVVNAWQVMKGREYEVVLTTGGGLYRYRLCDRIRVTGFFNQAPCIVFMGRNNMVSDQVGEKLNALHIEKVLRYIEEKIGIRFLFAMLAPHRQGICMGYVLYAKIPEGVSPDIEELANMMEHELCTNYHYQYARRLSQLEPVKIYRIHSDATTQYRNHYIHKGVKPGDIKFLALSSETNWDQVFTGEYVATMIENTLSDEIVIME